MKLDQCNQRVIVSELSGEKEFNQGTSKPSLLSVDECKTKAALHIFCWQLS
jgi:hypothetical protein